MVKKILGSVAFFVCCFIFMAYPKSALAVGGSDDSQTCSVDENVEELSQENQETLDQVLEYIEIDDNGLPVFNMDRAINSNESDNILEIGDIINTMNEETYGYDSPENYRDELAFRSFSLGIGTYGRYCGKGNKGGTPKDDLDYACYRHDVCYVHGKNNSSCNKAFVNRLNKVINKASKKSYKYKYAVAAKAYFSRFN